MTTTTLSPTTTRTTSIAQRIGLVLAALLGVLDIGNAISQWTDNSADPTAWAGAAFGVATLVLIPFAWRGRGGALIAVAVLRILSGLLGLPAFFIPGVPAPFVIAAAVGIVLAVVAAVLILVRKRA